MEITEICDFQSVDFDSLVLPNINDLFLDGGGIYIVIDRFHPGSTNQHEGTSGDLCLQCCIQRNSAKCEPANPDVYIQAIKVSYIRDLKPKF